MQNRQQQLKIWLTQVLTTDKFTLMALNGDASFRRYLRLDYEGRSFMVMDAPPEQEDLSSFIHVGTILSNLGLIVPQIYSLNPTAGFVILDDFGDELLLNQDKKECHQLYLTAINIILLLQNYPKPLNVAENKIYSEQLDFQSGTNERKEALYTQYMAEAKQVCNNAENSNKKSIAKNIEIPFFDDKIILQELQLFIDWFLEQYLNISLNNAQNNIMMQTFSWLAKEVNAQPKVLMHRDYHSRNIMLIKQPEQVQLGIIDFQDAMYGPFTYDLVSLLRDCYIKFSDLQLNDWMHFFYQNSVLAQQYSWLNFQRFFDLCGLQRHLKILGIFSRLFLRDHKSQYLQDLPLAMYYVMTCLSKYPELSSFYQMLQNLASMHENLQQILQSNHYHENSNDFCSR